MTEHDPVGRAADATVVEFYWRPGCPYCRALRGPLRRSGLPVREINIWEDPQAAERVRSVAGGNETVPTVFVGSHAMVNPGMARVLAAVRVHAPQLADGAEPTTPRWQPVTVALGLALLWVLLAVRTPTTTYHLAPLLVAAAAPVTSRWLTRTPASPRPAAVLAVTSLAITGMATAALTWQGLLAGPDITGRAAPAVEAALLAVVGAVLGWWIAWRGGRRSSF
jgi:glutaredoxin-like protein